MITELAHVSLSGVIADRMHSAAYSSGDWRHHRDAAHPRQRYWRHLSAREARTPRRRALLPYSSEQ